MKALLIGYKSCSTCKKTEKFLEEKKIEYKFQDVKEEKPEKNQIKDLYEKWSWNKEIFQHIWTNL